MYVCAELFIFMYYARYYFEYCSFDKHCGNIISYDLILKRQNLDANIYFIFNQTWNSN